MGIFRVFYPLFSSNQAKVLYVLLNLITGILRAQMYTLMCLVYLKLKSNLKEINPEYSLEGLTLELQYFDHLMQRADPLEKTLMLGKPEGRRREQQRMMVGWHHQLNGHELEQTPGDGEGQGSLACCSPWSHKETRLSN